MDDSMYKEFNVNTDMGILTPGRRIKLYRGEEVILLKLSTPFLKIYNIQRNKVDNAFIGEISHTAGRRQRSRK